MTINTHCGPVEADDATRVGSYTALISEPKLITTLTSFTADNVHLRTARDASLLQECGNQRRLFTKEKRQSPKNALVILFPFPLPRARSRPLVNDVE
jgi:hypothetical protein